MTAVPCDQGQVEELLEHGGGVGAVERSGGLVREDHGGPVDQGTGDGDTLALPTGDLTGPTLTQVTEAEALEDLDGYREGGALALPGQPQRQSGVLLDG